LTGNSLLCVLDSIDSDLISFKEKMENVIICIDRCMEAIDEINTYFQKVRKFIKKPKYTFL